MHILSLGRQIHPLKIYNMKSTIIILAFMLASSGSHGQLPGNIKKTEPLKFTSATFQMKSKWQKKLAWIFLGSGLVSSITGLEVIKNNRKVTINDPITYIATLGWEGSTTKNSTAGNILFAGGFGLMSGSIPLFIAAHRNKKNAALSIDREKTSYLTPHSFHQSVPCIKLSIPIGR